MSKTQSRILEDLEKGETKTFGRVRWKVYDVNGGYVTEGKIAIRAELKPEYSSNIVARWYEREVTPFEWEDDDCMRSISEHVAMHYGKYLMDLN